MRLRNIPFKAESALMRAWYRKTGVRPGSNPYVSGDGFRTLTGFRYEKPSAGAFDPASVPPGALVYCDGWLLNGFLKTVAPRLVGPVRVISHNADPNIGPEVVRLLPPQVEKLFSMNVLVSDPRVIALPIGLENACLHYNGVVSDFNKLRRKPKPKEPRILVAFTVGTNTLVRGPARQALLALQTVDTLDRINSRTYRKIASKYQFIASPPGNGEDCHRTWEALYLGAVPIVIRSALTETFAALGLPLWLVDSYEELANFDEAALDARYKELTPKFRSRALWMEFWQTVVESGSLP